MDLVSASGLTEPEAHRLLTLHGANELPARGGRGLGPIVLETMREPMFLLLIGASALYLFLGDLGEGLFLLAGAAASVGLVIVQEARSERALAALRELAQPLARVIRDGAERQIAARELVPGDILLVGEGERLPADGQLVGGEVLAVDESTLTGEPAPVTKEPVSKLERETADPVPGADHGPFLFGGSLVVRGQGVMQVTRTGIRSALGKIGRALASIEQEPTPLQRTAGRLAAILGGVALGFCGVVALAYGLVRGDWIGGVLAGITAAISLIPEEFPMVLAVFLALGAWRLARQQVLARRSAVIETLGAASVLCVDKTGTLTENRMRLARLWTAEGDMVLDGGITPGGQAAELVRVAMLASAVRPVDPMDKAIHAFSGQTGVLSPLLENGPERAWPLRPQLLAVVQLWDLGRGAYLLAAKGAPEAIFGICRLPENEITRLHEVIRDYADAGLRVLAVAAARGKGAPPDEPSDVEFQFMGLAGFLDPLRADVPAALKEGSAAGIKVIMITGDHPATALAVARTAGIDTVAGAITGSELAAMAPRTLGERLRDTRVFARIVPDQKLALVQALKAEGEVVAMTGDGVNDAPALEAADIGISMGRRGADVAREASDLVLLDDSFASIIGGVRLGRRIFGNLRRALIYITAIHVPIAGLALVPVLLGLPPLLFPVHVVLLELAIDPTCALVFEVEPGDETLMRTPPRPLDEALFGRRQLGLAVLQGLVLLGGVLGLYVLGLKIGSGEAARGGAFLALVVGNLALSWTNSASSRTLFSPHRRIYWGIAFAVMAAMTAVFAVPGLAQVFSVARPRPWPLFGALFVGLAAGGWSAPFHRSRSLGASG